MATPIGQNTIEAISRRVIEDGIVDTIYKSTPFTFRMLDQGRKMYTGGTQLEIPLMTSRRGTGTWYGGVETLPVQLSDTLKNLAFNWKYYSDIVAFSDVQLATADSPLKVADIVATQIEQAIMETVDNLDQALWSLNSPNTLAPDSIPNAVDDGTNVTSYGGWNKTALPAVKGNYVTNAGATISLAKMMTVFGDAKLGGQEPTIIMTDQYVYNEFWGLLVPLQRYGGDVVDTKLANAGFSNVLFQQVPVVVGSYVPQDTGGNHQMFFLNENFWRLNVLKGREFTLGEFQEIPNQNAYVAKLKLSCNLTCSNSQRQAVLFDIT